jgi:Tol biopolymer transport system component/DNA-binding winged helix-turn-helix (wHTH) protein
MREQNHYLYAFGPFHLDATRRVLLKEGQPVKLFPKEFDTLLALVERSGELMEKDELMRQVWPDAVVEESNLTTNISHLRKILGESRSSHDYIVTVPGRGYRFVAGVEVEGESLESSTEAAVSQPVRAVTTTRAHGHMVLSGKLLISVIAVGLTVVTFLSYRFTKNREAVAFNEIKFTRLTNSGRATLAAMSPDGKYIVHASKDSNGESLWLKQVLTQSDVQIAPPAETVYWGLTFSPDGQYIYCVTAELNKGDTTLSVIPVLGGAPRRLPTGPHGPVSFSPDGKSFAFVNAYRDVFHLYIADKDGGAPRLVASRKSPEKFIDIAVGPAWSPDGSEIACGVRKYDENGYFDSVVAISVKDGSERSLTSHRWSSVGQIAWLPGASGLVITARESPSTPFQIWQLPMSGGEVRRVTNDLNDYRGISYNAATRSLIAIQTNVVSGIWLTRSGDLTEGRVAPEHNASRQFPVEESSGIQIASETGRLPDIAWTANGRIVYVSYAANGSSIWVRDPGESTPRQLAVDTRNVHGLTVSPDGRHLVLSSDRTGTFNLWHVEMNGGELVRLTDGEDVSPRFSPDGQWVVFQRGYPTGARIWRVPHDGGEAVPLTQTRGQRPDVSRDGKLIAYHTLDSEFESSPWVFGAMSFEGGPLIKRFSFPATVMDRMVRWVPGGWGLAYVDTSGGVSNVWVQPLDGGHPWQLSNFKSERIDSFEWSPDGRWLAAVRGSETSDVVLMQPTSK